MISYDKHDDTTRIQYENARDVIVIFSDETFIEIDTPDGVDTIPIKDLIILIENEKEKEKEKEKDNYKEKDKENDSGKELIKKRKNIIKKHYV